MARVFLSCASEDRRRAEEVHGWLVGAGHEVFFDRDLHDGVAAGEWWQDRLHERLRWADAVVCVLTSAYVGSVWCSAEVGIARSQGTLLIPLLAEQGVVHPLLPASVVQQVDYVADPGAARARVGEALRRVDAGGGRGWPDGRNPYPGLLAFDTDWHRVFFGRRTEAEALARLLRSPAERAESGLVVVVGPSGCGKSSLVRAGLLPRMAGEPGWWVLPAVLPGADPVAALARELAAEGVRLGAGWTLRQVSDRLAGESGLVQVAEELLVAAADSGRRSRLLVVVDQYEELLTRTPAATRARFAELLRPALGHPVQVVATLRPEFLAPLLADRELAGLPARIFPLRPLRREALASVIAEPARVAGIDIDRELVDRLVGDTGGGEALPLLAFALAQLADGVGRGGHLSADRYEELGGVRAALVGQADAALAEAQASTGRPLGEVLAGLLRLVTVDEQGRPTGRRVPRGQLPPPVATEIDAFIRHRLVSSDTSTDAGDDAVVVGVAHEAVLSAWPPLAAAITAAGTALRARRAVELAAADWADSGRPPERLWERGQLAAALADTGARLQPAKQRADRPAGRRRLSRAVRRIPGLGARELASDKVDLTETARTFLRTSIRRDRRRRARALTVLSTLLVVALAATAAAGIGLRTARQQRHTADEQRLAAEQNQLVATARQLVAQAEAVRGTNDGDALLLGIAAQHLHDDGETRTSLVNTLLATRYAGRLDSDNGQVWSVAFGPDGHTLATSGSDGTVVLWDLADRGHPARLGVAPTGLNGAPVVFSPDGHILAASNSDGTVVLWDLADRSHLTRLSTLERPPQSPATSEAFSPDGHTLATGNFDGTVVLWNLTDRGHPARLGTTSIGQRGSASVVFSPDGRTLATSNSDGTVVLWDLADRSHLTRLSALGHGRQSPALVLVAFSPDRRTLATAGIDGTIALWDVADRGHPARLGARLHGHHSEVASVAFSPDGRTMATADGDGSVVLWDVGDRYHPARLCTPLNGHPDLVVSVAFSPDLHTLVTGNFDGTVVLWDLTNCDRRGRRDVPLTEHHSKVVPVAFSPDVHTLATTDIDETVVLWDLDHDRPTRLGTPLNKHFGLVSVAFSPDGHTLATSNGKAVILWDLTDRGHPTRLGTPLNGNPNEMALVAFSPDGRTLATGNAYGEAVLWDLTNRAKPARLGTQLTGLDSVVGPERPESLIVRDVGLVAFSPDGRTLATGNIDGTVILWDLTDRHHPTRFGEPIAGHSGQLVTVAFSPDGRTLATADGETVILWDLTDRGHPTRLGTPLTGHHGTVASVAFSPDGNTLATGSYDKTVILWDLTDRGHPTRLGTPLTGHRGQVLTVAFNRDGRTLTTGSNDGRVILWDLTELNRLRSNPLAAACSVTGRGFTREEWHQYIPDLPYQDTCPG